MYYGNNYYQANNAIASTLQTMWTILIVTAIIAVVGGIVIMATFMAKKNENRYSGFLERLYDFLHFKSLLSETLIKAIYLISAIFLTLYCFGYLFFVDIQNVAFGWKFLAFLISLVLGNVVLRVVYEFLIIRLVVCKNTSEINKKLSKMNSNSFNGGIENGMANQHPQQMQEPQQGVTFCRNCGQQFDASESECPNCGCQK